MVVYICCSKSGDIQRRLALSFKTLQGFLLHHPHRICPLLGTHLSGFNDGWRLTPKDKSRFFSSPCLILRFWNLLDNLLTSVTDPNSCYILISMYEISIHIIYGLLQTSLDIPNPVKLYFRFSEVCSYILNLVWCPWYGHLWYLRNDQFICLYMYKAMMTKNNMNFIVRDLGIKSVL